MASSERRVHCKKMVSDFPGPNLDVTNQTLPGREKFNYSRQGRVWIVTSRLGTGKSLTFFDSVAKSERWVAQSEGWALCQRDAGWQMCQRDCWVSQRGGLLDRISNFSKVIKTAINIWWKKAHSTLLFELFKQKGPTLESYIPLNQSTSKGKQAIECPRHSVREIIRKSVRPCTVWMRINQSCTNWI
jgi:hypothetical protein